MIIVIESVILCALFTIMVYVISREPIKTLYNYPPKIQERVKSLDEYKETQTAVKARINELEAKLQSQPEKTSPSKLKKTIQEVIPALRSSALSEEEKNSILKSFISKVIFYKPSGDLDLFFYV